MKTLVFEHDGWTVATSSWSVASKRSGDDVEICYTWGADQVGILQTQVSTARTTLPLTINQFLKRLATAGVIVDLR